MQIIPFHCILFTPRSSQMWNYQCYKSFLAFNFMLHSLGFILQYFILIDFFYIDFNATLFSQSKKKGVWLFIIFQFRKPFIYGLIYNLHVNEFEESYTFHTFRVLCYICVCFQNKVLLKSHFMLLLIVFVKITFYVVINKKCSCKYDFVFRFKHKKWLFVFLINIINELNLKCLWAFWCGITRFSILFFLEMILFIPFNNTCALPK